MRFIGFDKPLVAAVHGAAIGGGTTMLTHCDFVYAGESARFQMPFINLALVPEFGSSCSLPARIGHIRAAELILLGEPFERRARGGAGLGDAASCPTSSLFATATETARKLAAKPGGALQATKRLLKRAFRRAGQGGDEGRRTRSSARGCARRRPRKRSRLSWRSAHPNFTKTASAAAA